MGNELAHLFVVIGASTRDFNAELGKMEREIKKSFGNIQKECQKVGLALTGLGLAILAPLGKMVAMAAEEQVSISQLAAILNNVGVSYDQVSVSLERYLSLVQRQTGVADNEQREALSRLIMVVNDYDTAMRLLPLTLDLAAAGQMDTTTAATYLGKAYIDLAKGAQSVAVRMGQASVQFRSLAEIQERVGGAAAAMANPFNVLKNAVGDLGEQIGFVLLPFIKDLIDRIVGVVDAIKNWIAEHPTLAKWILYVTVAVGALALALGTTLLAIAGLIMIAPAMAAAWALITGPIGLIVLAITAVIAAIALLVIYWDEVWNAIKAVTQAVVNFLISQVLGMVNSYVNMFIGLINTVISLLNLIPGIDIEKIASVKLNYEIPKFAGGGLFTRPTLGIIGDVPEVLTPLSALGGVGRGMAGGATVNIYPRALLGTKNDVITWIREALYNEKLSNVNLGLS